MDRLNWVDIDGVRYSWDGNQIDCYGQFGYHSRLTGHHLEQLEIDNAAGDPLGILDVDFATGKMVFRPEPGAELGGMSVLTGGDAGEREHLLSSLIEMGGCDLLLLSDDLLDPGLIVERGDNAAPPPACQCLSWESFGLLESDQDPLNDALAPTSPPPAASEVAILLGDMGANSLLPEILPPYQEP